MTIDRPRRSFWRIHLLTAVVMLLATAVVLYLNTKPEYEVYLSREAMFMEQKKFLGRAESEIDNCSRGFPYRFMDTGRFRFNRLAWDVLVGFSCVALAGFLAESLVRRRGTAHP